MPSDPIEPIICGVITSRQLAVQYRLMENGDFIFFHGLHSHADVWPV